MLSYELRENILDYVNSGIDFEVLREWYVPRLREFLAQPESADADVVAVLENLSVMLAEDLISDDDAKDLLWDALGQHSDLLRRSLSQSRSIATSSTSQSGYRRVDHSELTPIFSYSS